jgi:hypothetical protein
MESGFILLRRGLNEPSGKIKGRKFIDQLRSF